MSSHTPGPWRIKEAQYRHHYQPHDTDICTPDGRGLICTLYTENWDHKGIIDKANAKLIAAAPTMYSLIKQLAAEGNKEAAALVESIDANS